MIKDLVSTEKLSEECLEFCREQQIDSLSSLIGYFQNVENLGIIEIMNAEVRNELKCVCKKHIDRSTIQPRRDIPLKELRVIEHMSMRAYMICNCGELNSLKAIMKAGENPSAFRQSWNPEAKSYEELHRLCKKYSYLLTCLDFADEAPGGEEQMPVREVEFIDLQTLADIEDMSVRAFNICSAAGLDSLGKIVDFYYAYSNSEFRRLRNCGNYTNAELKRICLKYTSPVKEVDPSGLDSDENNGKEHSAVADFLDSLMLEPEVCQVAKDFISGLSTIPLFQLLNLLIDSNFVFHNERNTLIFKKAFNFYLPDSESSYEEIGSIVGLTGERVRQLRESIYLQLSGRSFRFIKTSNAGTVFSNYIPSYDLPAVCITDKDAEKINLAEQTCFSPVFITHILSQLHRDRFVIVGDQKVLFRKNIFKGGNCSQRLFLIDRKIASQFRFDEFIRHMSYRIHVRREEDELLPYSELIDKYKSADEINIDRMINAINTIALNDFGDFVEAKEKGLNFYRNKQKSHRSGIIEILADSDKPLHFTEIHKQYVSKFSRTPSVETISSTLANEKDIFGLKGFGIYDLCSKGGLFGKIGDVAEQILKAKNAAIHYQELEKMILKELLVKRESIPTVLFNYRNEKRFIRDAGGYVSLRSWRFVIHY